MRAFIAIPIPFETLRECAAARTDIVSEAPSWAGEKWVPSENLHVTLKFLGETDAQTLTRLAQELCAIALHHTPFSLKVRGLTAVPHPRKSTMIWADYVDLDGACQRLHEEVESLAMDAGVAPESRPFTPHVTIVRARRPRPIDPGILTSAAQHLRPMSVQWVSVYSSTLTHQGARYETVAKVHLGHD